MTNTGISNHKAVAARLNTVTPTTIRKKRKVYLFKKADKNALNAFLRDSLHSFRSYHVGVQKMWNDFKEKVSTAIERYTT